MIRWQVRKYWISAQRNWRVLVGLSILALGIFFFLRYKLLKYDAVKLRTLAKNQAIALEYGNRKMEPSTASDRAARGSVGAKDPDRVKVELYMESRCPDTSVFIERQLWSSWTAIKDIIDLEVIPFGKASCTQKGDDFLCNCQHLERECALNQLMNCVIDQLKAVDLYLPVLVCLQGKTVEDGADACLTQAGLTSAPLIQCANSQKGRKLHAQAGKRTKALDPRMYFVPWIVINGQRNERSLMNFKREICNSYRGKNRPASC